MLIAVTIERFIIKISIKYSKNNIYNLIFWKLYQKKLLLLTLQLLLIFFPLPTK